MRSLALFIIISVLIHLSSYEGVNILVTNWLETRRPRNTTEIELVQNDPPTVEKALKEKPILHQLDALNPIDNDQPARFDSEKTQRVKVETKARDFGLTRNQTVQKNSKILKQEKKMALDSDSVPEFVRYVGGTQSHNSPSKISQDLPSDIQQSDTTNLNTDANIYYSFYNRVEELYRVRWEERLYYYWNRLSLDFKKNNLAGKAWTTTFEVTLKASGEYHTATILQSCGYPPFDEAAIFAFKDARFFPNVPKAKVEPDGLVRLRYRFRVSVGP